MIIPGASINKNRLGDIPIRLRTIISTHMALLGLAVFAFWPLLRAGPTTAVDGKVHFFRLAELHWAIHNSILYPRWLPDFAYGFGVPAFNFYPPLSYWVAEVWALMGMSLSRALSVGYFFALLAMVLGSYLWARAVFRSDIAALASAAARSASASPSSTCRQWL